MFYSRKRHIWFQFYYIKVGFNVCVCSFNHSSLQFKYKFGAVIFMINKTGIGANCSAISVHIQNVLNWLLSSQFDIISINFRYMSHSTKMKEFGRKKKQKNNTAYFDSFSFKTQL